MSIARQTEIMEQQQESITKGVNNINSDHAIIHMGYGGLTDDYFTLGNGATKEYCFTCPTVLYPHFKNIKLQGLGGSVKLEILRGATVTVNTGTAVLITNPNDNAPTFIIHAIKEVDGANLDRAQIIKGWVDANGETHEILNSSFQIELVEGEYKNRFALVFQSKLEANP